jgi:hypothetical protein
MDYAVRDSKWLNQQILAALPTQLELREPPEVKRTRLGVPNKLLKLFARVERGELSAARATSMALDILQKGAPEALTEILEIPEQLAKEFKTLAPHAPERPPNAVWDVSDGAPFLMPTGHWIASNFPRDLPARRPQRKREQPRPPAVVPSLPVVKRRGVVATRDKKGQITIRDY